MAVLTFHGRIRTPRTSVNYFSCSSEWRTSFEDGMRDTWDAGRCGQKGHYQADGNGLRVARAPGCGILGTNKRTRLHLHQSVRA